MTGCNGKAPPGAGFIVTNAPDLQNLLKEFAQGVAASTQEDAQEDAHEDAREGAIR